MTDAHQKGSRGHTPCVQSPSKIVTRATPAVVVIILLVQQWLTSVELTLEFSR
jgi:hypothetical protein